MRKTNHTFPNFFHLLAALLAALLLLTACQPAPRPTNTPTLKAGPAPTPTPSGPPVISLQRYAGGLQAPSALAWADDDPQALYIAETPGRIRRLPLDGAAGSEPQAGLILDITDRVRSPASDPNASGEEGLLGLVFPPDFAARRYFYVYYTGNGDLSGTPVSAEGPLSVDRLSRFYLLPGSEQADPASEQIILQLEPTHKGEHNAGQLAYGPDGYLHVGLGDGGGSGDPFGNAQNPGVLMGKILRIEVETVPADAQPPYSIPPDNPFVGQNGYRPEIWALGLRNPWRFAFDRLSGDLYIGDVGEKLAEEVNYQPADSQGGENYGWNILEGSHCFKPAEGCQPPDNYAPPLLEFLHEGEMEPPNCAVIGGAVYRGSRFPALDGVYFYADFCSGRLWGLRGTGSQPWLLADTELHPTAIGEAADGELYLLNLGNGAEANGEVYWIVGEE